MIKNKFMQDTPDTPTPMHQTLIAWGQQFLHNSATVTKTVNYIIQQMNLERGDKVTINEELDLDDYGNEYAFLIKFTPQDPTLGDLAEELDAITAAQDENEDSDFAITAKYDHCNNSTFFILITFCK